MRFLFILICSGLVSTHLFAQNNKYVQYKNYYLLTLLQKDPATRKILENDFTFKDLLKDKDAKINDAIKNCSNNIGCYAAAIKFSNREISAISENLRSLFKTDNALDQLVRNQLIPSGCYGLYKQLSPGEILVKAWEQDAASINHAISVYTQGLPPNYPAIDSIGFDIKAKGYPELVNTNMILSSDPTQKLFFEPAMRFALISLEINERNDAADFEPLATGVNKMALSAIEKTNFKNYKYSLILVPGEGPEEQNTALSVGGMLRCRLAAVQYYNKVAPFIMVSGGRVHPYKTKYSEALEMKKYLMHTLQVPESAILMEPHARHTTTNMRNAARIIFRYHMPVEQPALVVTAKSQSMYISNVLLKRCIKELGYEPYKLGKRLSDNELEFYPNAMSLQIDFDEPMDP